MTKRSVLVIAHESDGPGGQVAERFAQRGFSVDTHVVVPDLEHPDRVNPIPEFDGYDVIAIMGSIRSLTDIASISHWVERELDLIRAARAADQPLLGVCFGGQLIAHALGGSVETAPVGEIGHHLIRTADGVDDADNPAGVGPWMQWHHDRFTPPPGATLLAVSDHADQLFRIGRMVGTQFHPESDIDHLNGWLESAHDDYLAANDVDRDALLADAHRHEERHVADCHAFVDWFIDTMVDTAAVADQATD